MDVSNPDELQRLAAFPKASAWVAASAGSGKTKVLSDRVLNLLLDGTPPEKILCLTFTRTAAAEMENRIAGRLAAWTALSDEQLAAELRALSGKDPEPETADRARRLFAGLLDAPGGLKIMTIHSFCQSLLKRFPLEAGVSPQFDVLDERGARDLIEQAQETVLSRPEFDPDMDIVAELTDEEGFGKAMCDMTLSLDRLGTLSALSAEELRRRYEKALGLPEGATRDSLVSGFCTLTPAREEELKTAAVLLGKGSGKTDSKNAATIARFLALPPEGRAEILDDYLSVFLKSDDVIRSGLAHNDTKEALPYMEREAARALEINELLKSERVLCSSLALVHIGVAVMKEYAELKTFRSVMDYDDLIAATRRLLEKSGAAAWVLFKLDGGIDHILVDEAQDTSPAQWAVVRALAEEFFAGEGARPQNRTLFAVGDRKQSIYSFQGADPDEFERMRRLFRDKAQGAGKKWNDVPMYISFRSTPAVIDAVNHVLRSENATKGVLEAGEDGTHLSWRRAEAGLVEIWPTEKSEKTDKNRPFTKPVERTFSENASTRLAKKIALRIHRMIQNGERLESQDRPIRPGDILILVRRRNAFLDVLSRELKALGIPVSGVDRLKIASHIAVMDLMVLGDFLLLPEDDLSLATVLRSPLCGLSEEELFRLAHGRGEKTLFARLSEESRHGGRFAEAYAFLTDMLSRVDAMRTYELYAYVLGPKGGRKAFVSRLGLQALDALDEFMSLALNYDVSNTPSLQNFLRWIRRNDIEIKRDSDQKTFDAVRMMTVHGAKGLQAPIIFLPDTRQYKSHSPTYFWLTENEEASAALWVPRAEMRDSAAKREKERREIKEKEEYNRLLYVAMTRAADRLYVCGWDNKTNAPDNNWYDLIRGALPFTEENKAEDPLFDEPVLRFESRQEKPAAKEKQNRTETVSSALPEWALKPPPPEPTPPRPLFPSRPETPEPAALSPLTENRENALRRGTLIHGLLEILPAYALEERDAVTRAFMEKNGAGLSEAEKNKITEDVGRILNNPVCAPLFSENSLAEIPITGLLEGRVVSGRIDRLAVSPDEVLLVDYKSNRAVPGSLEDVPKAYRRQAATYAALLKRIYPDRKIRCFLLWTEEAFLMELPSLVD